MNFDFYLDLRAFKLMRTSITSCSLLSTHKNLGMAPHGVRGRPIRRCSDKVDMIE